LTGFAEKPVENSTRRAKSPNSVQILFWLRNNVKALSALGLKNLILLVSLKKTEERMRLDNSWAPPGHGLSPSGRVPQDSQRGLQFILLRCLICFFQVNGLLQPHILIFRGTTCNRYLCHGRLGPVGRANHEDSLPGFMACTTISSRYTADDTRKSRFTLGLQKAPASPLTRKETPRNNFQIMGFPTDLLCRISHTH